MYEAGTVLERTVAAQHERAVNAALIERLKWRSRRGLLELDIVFERFWAHAGGEMNDGDAAMLERLLALPDNDLLDLVMGRADTSETYVQPMLRRLRTV